MVGIAVLIFKVMILWVNIIEDWTVVKAVQFVLLATFFTLHNQKSLTNPDQVSIIELLALKHTECQKLKIIGGLPNVKTIR